MAKNAAQSKRPQQLSSEQRLFTKQRQPLPLINNFNAQLPRFMPAASMPCH